MFKWLGLMQEEDLSEHLIEIYKEIKDLRGRIETLEMPYKSKAQEAYFNVNKAKLEKQGVDVDEWNKASAGKKLPKRSPKKKK